MPFQNASSLHAYALPFDSYDNTDSTRYLLIKDSHLSNKTIELEEEKENKKYFIKKKRKK